MIWEFVSFSTGVIIGVVGTLVVLVFIAFLTDWRAHDAKMIRDLHGQ